MSATAKTIEALVTAETAPLGVQLWPTTDDAHYARNFTLAEVARVLGADGETYVRWTYQSGDTRQFSLGDRVMVGVYRREDLDGANAEWMQAPTRKS